MWQVSLDGNLAGRARLAVRRYPGSAICRSTAAWLWGIDVLPPGLTEQDAPVELFVPEGTPWPRRPGIRPTRSKSPGDLVVRGDITLTDPWRTALDCARSQSRYEAMACLDAFTRAGMSTDLLAEYGKRLPPGSRGSRQAVELLALTDPRAESPGESWTRLLIVDAGLPVPDCQVPVRCGDTMFWLDLGYPEYRIGIEYDGRQHHTLPADRHHDERRRTQIRSAGWEIVVIRAEDLCTHPRALLESVLDTLLTGRWNPCPERIDEIKRRITRIAGRSR